MKLKPHFDTDLLNRQQSIERLSNLLTNIEEPYTIAIDGDWGTGKTTFIKLWEDYLKTQQLKDGNNKEIVSIYFNAWDNDFESEVLNPFVKKIFEKNKYKQSFIDVWETIKDIFEVYRSSPFFYTISIITILCFSFYFIISTGILTSLLGVSFFFKENILNWITFKFIQDISSKFDESFNKKTKKASYIHKQIKQHVEKSDIKYIIFVDELDRCRPTYAIELLERIKHFFNINNVVFVLSMNKEQLQHSIKAVYGSEFDAHHYLKRFIDTEFTLIRPELSNIYLLKDYIEFHLTELNMDNELFDKYYFLRTCVDLITIFELTLRQINHVIQIVKIIISSNLNIFRDGQKHGEHTIIIFLIIIKQIEFQLVYDFCHRKITAYDFFNSLFKKYSYFLSMPTGVIDEKQLSENQHLFLEIYNILEYMESKATSSAKSTVIKQTYNFETVRFEFKEPLSYNIKFTLNFQELNNLLFFKI